MPTPAIGATRASSNTITMPCTKCAGHGRIPLPPHLQAILKYLQTHGPQSASALYRKLPEATKGGRSAMNNALGSLEAQGLARRSGERFGEGFIWTAIEPGENE